MPSRFGKSGICILCRGRETTRRLHRSTNFGRRWISPPRLAQHFLPTRNFDVPELELLNSYPLSKVREIHLSGGSWSPSVSGKRLAVRRDTHDDSVPQEVFNLATLALKLCPNIEFVIMERLGHTMLDQESPRRISRRLRNNGRDFGAFVCLKNFHQAHQHHRNIQNQMRHPNHLSNSRGHDFQDALLELLSNGLPLTPFCKC